MLSTVGERQIAQIRQVLKDVLDVEVLQLRDDEAEHFVASLLELLDHFAHGVLRFKVFEQVLHVRFDVGLLETVAVLLALNILSFHFAAEALLLPVELKVDVSRHSGHRQVAVCQFHNFSQDLFVFDALELRV